MITVPAFPDLLKPGAPCVWAVNLDAVPESPRRLIYVGVGDGDRSVVPADGFRMSIRVIPTCDLRLILDDPDRIGQTLALGWLARRLGVVMPPAGCPVWRRRDWDDVIVYRLGSDGGRDVWFGATDPEVQVGSLVCPALDNPDAADAPIRALALAVETVGRMP